jgi:aryl-alcohol dehydrogenase-like predicted oxidoreductase
MQEYIEINGTNLISSRIALGTWAIGGWMWGGTDEKESIRTIHAAFDHGVNLIDTAPIYGYGRSEAIVGEAVRLHGRRDGVISPRKSASTGRTVKSNVTRCANASLRNSRIRYAVSKRTTLIFTRCIGPIL